MTGIGMYTFLGCLVCLSLQSSSVQATTCWSSWINDNHPADVNNRTDTEIIPVRSKLQASCQGDPKPELKVQCMDSNGEPFTGTPDKRTSHYTVTCGNTTGLICEPFPDFVANNYTCPDLFMQVGCDCPATSGAGNQAPTQPSSPAVATGGGASTAQATATGNHGNNGGGAAAVSLVLHVIQVALMLAIVMW